MYDYNSVVGNDMIIKSLKLAVKNNRINHAYIFDGPRGRENVPLQTHLQRPLTVKGEEVPPAVSV